MTDEEIKLRRLRYAIEEDMTENELFEIARERRYRINDLQEENAELKKQDKICEEIIIGEQIEIDRLNKENAEQKAQIENMKCCGNCKHHYERKVEQGGRCKDHYSDSVCENYESDEMTADKRLHNEWD